MNYWGFTMKKKFLVIISVAIVIVFFVSVFLVPADDAKRAAMTSLCSQVTKDNVKSPSSYKMTSAMVSLKQLSNSEIEKKVRNMHSEAMSVAVSKGLLTIRSGEVFVDFEASNAMGVSLKGLTKCDFDNFSDSWSSLEAVSIDGNQLSGSDIIIASAGKKIESGFTSKALFLIYKVTGKI